MTDLSWLKSKRNSNSVVPVEPKLPPAPRISDRAAEVATHVENLEQDLANAEAFAQEQKNRAEVAEQLLSESRATAKRLEVELDHWKTRHVAVMSHMRAGSHVFLQCLRYEDEPLPAMKQHETANLASVAAALTEEPPDVRPTGTDEATNPEPALPHSEDDREPAPPLPRRRNEAPRP